jgi:hypothetical protein
MSLGSSNRENTVSKALIQVKQVKHPISEETIGFRLQAAHPNMAGRDWKGNPKPSFAKRFLIAEGSDHPAIPTEQDYIKFCDEVALPPLHRVSDRRHPEGLSIRVPTGQRRSFVAVIAISAQQHRRSE